eukprot:TRINITY_DN9065_c0_g2_i1.p1 TRINITY_DN9065_c0_g2~~TRINITY_DN9065_c0_g2_i1.p1  ORF type:complete len:404 (+),score=106.22 TRINITY_DN9065_c0_g2_i1:147-1358(+)
MASLDELRITEEKKRYIVDKLNPVLEEMMADCIHREPRDPTSFLIDWLDKKRVFNEDKALSVEEKERLVRENEVLKDDVAKAKRRMQQTVKFVVDDGGKQEAEEEEEDDVDDEPPPGFFLDKPKTKARQSVSAEAYGEWNSKQTFVAPIVTKTDEQKERLKNCLCKSFMFANLEESDIIILVGAMKEVQVEAKQRVINQGESGDFLFVIESGRLHCLVKKPDGCEKIVKVCDAGDVTGELALLYNCPRAASVQAAEKSILWQLDRETFNHIVKDGAQKKRARYDAFLSKVGLLESMDAYERSQLADALRVECVKEGTTIVSQGEEGKKFYIIEEGEAVATKGGVQVMSYGFGDYFGELALIRNQARAATVTSKTPCKLLVLDSGSFNRLLNVDDLLSRADKYE